MRKLFIITLLVSFSINALSADLAGCRPQLEKSLCYSPAMEHWASDSDNLLSSLKAWQERKCAPVPAHLKQTLLSVYEQYPVAIQKAFCEIRKVFIVSGEVSYGALAEYYFDLSTVKIKQGEWNPHFTGRPIGYVLEISEQNRFKGESSVAYFTRVLRARFGNAGATADQLPLADFKDPFGTNGALATTIVHELGHLLGRAQKVTSTYFLPLSEGAWSKVSFRLEGDSYSLKHATADYEQRMGLKILGNQDVQPTFDLFRKAGVATLYGATVPQEDFAEFFMLYFYGDLKWMLNGKVAFDLQKEMVSNTAFKAKRDIIQKLMSMPEPFSLKNRGNVSGEIGAM